MMSDNRGLFTFIVIGTICGLCSLLRSSPYSAVGNEGIQNLSWFQQTETTKDANTTTENDQTQSEIGKRSWEKILHFLLKQRLYKSLKKSHMYCIYSFGDS